MACMAAARVTTTSNDYGDVLEVNGYGSFGWHRNLDGLGAQRAIVGPASLSSMLRALRDVGQRDRDAPASLYTSSADSYHNKHSPIDSVWLKPDDSGRYYIGVEVELESMDVDDAEEGKLGILRDWLAIALDNSRDAFAIEFEANSGFAGLPLLVTVYFPCPERGVVNDALELGRRIETALKIYDDGGYSYDRVRTLALSGNTAGLLGVPETDWLEAKSFGYALGSDSQKVELARDVARFANGDDSAMILIGLRAKRKADGEERVVAITAPQETDLNPAQYRAVIGRRLYPYPEGLKITKVPVSAGRAIMVIEIPKQRLELKPFLVSGAILNDRAEGAFISIVRRVGEGSESLSPAAIHAALRAGYRALEQRE
jgi:hypothetical protein